MRAARGGYEEPMKREDTNATNNANANGKFEAVGCGLGSKDGGGKRGNVTCLYLFQTPLVQWNEAARACLFLSVFFLFFPLFFLLLSLSFFCSVSLGLCESPGPCSGICLFEPGRFVWNTASGIEQGGEPSQEKGLDPLQQILKTGFMSVFEGSPCHTKHSAWISHGKVSFWKGSLCTSLFFLTAASFVEQACR